MAIRMGYWDCPGCGTNRIEGPQRECPHCGAPRDDGVEFYTDDDAPEVTDAELLQRAHAGADWHCPFCGADNRAGATECVSCGASDPAAKQREVKFIPDQSAAVAPVKAPAKRKGGRGPLVLIAVLAVIALVGAAVWFLFIRAKPLEVTVRGMTWTKALQIENLETQTHSDWVDEVPARAKEVSRTTKQRKQKVKQGTKRVKVGKKDLGNGMFEDVYEERPNYVDKMVDDTWVTYKIDRWVQGRKLKETRSDGTEPPVPSFTPTARSRIGQRENYVTLELEGKGERYKYDFHIGDSSQRRARAQAFKVGQRYTALVTALGAVKELK